VKFAKLISYIFHPGFMPTLVMLVLFNLDTYFRFSVSPGLKKFILGLVFINTFLFPLLILVFLKSRNAIDSFELKNRKNRIIPFGVSTLFFFFTYNFMRETSLPPIILSIFLGISLSMFIVFITSFFYKTSIHMVGVSGLLASILCLYVKFSANYLLEISTVTLIWGLVGYSRLKLKSHSVDEVYVGAGIGLVCVIIPAYFNIMI